MPRSAAARTASAPSRQHTPGPWAVDPNDDTVVNGADGYAVADTAGVHLHVDYDSEKGHWGSTPGAAREIPEEEEAANARLVAAAPSLLDDHHWAEAMLRTFAEKIAPAARASFEAGLKRMAETRRMAAEGAPSPEAPAFPGRTRSPNPRVGEADFEVRFRLRADSLDHVPTPADAEAALSSALVLARSGGVHLQSGYFVRVADWEDVSVSEAQNVREARAPEGA